MAIHLKVLVRQKRGVVNDGGEHVDCGHRYQQQECRLDDVALRETLAEQHAYSQQQEQASPAAVHEALVEQQSLGPPERKFYTIGRRLGPFRDRAFFRALFNVTNFEN